MSTLNNIELLIITIVLSLLFIVGIAAVIQFMLVVRKVEHLANKASQVVEDVEVAADTLKHLSRTSSKHFPILSLLHSVVNIGSKNDK